MPAHIIQYIALADDDVDDREIFTEICEDINVPFPVLLYRNGCELLDYLTSSGAQIPSILFLDINMPRKNGFESLHEIKSNPKLKDICVIMYSTSNNPPDILRAKKLGAKGFLQKPSNYGKLKSIIQRILETDWKNTGSEPNDLNFLILA